MQEAFDFAPPERRPRTERPANGARVKQKGSGYERAVAAILQAIWPEARRGDQRSSYFRCPDIDGTPIWWEAKAGKRVNLHGAWRQAVEDWKTRGRAFLFPIVVARNDRQPDLVLMRLSDFLPLVAAWAAQGGRGRSDAQTPASRGRRLLGATGRGGEAMSTAKLVRRYAAFALGLPEGASKTAANRALAHIEAEEDAGRVPFALANLAREAHLLLARHEALVAAANRYDALPNPEGALRQWIARAHALAGRKWTQPMKQARPAKAHGARS